MKITGKIRTAGATPAEVQLLEAADTSFPDDAGTAFALAQRLRAAGHGERALAAFDHRATMAGFDQEVYVSLLSAARLAAQLDRGEAEVVDRFLRAYEFRPSRPESLGSLAFYLREKGPRWQLAFLIASRAIEIPASTDVFHVESEWHEWRCLDEYAVAAYWIGEYGKCQEVCERLLKSACLPRTHQLRVRENLDHALRKLGHGQAG